MPHTPDIPSPNLDRRTLVRASAWSVPALTLTAAAPAFARSTVPAGSLSLKLGQFTGTRITTGSDAPAVRIQNLEIVNNGPSDLPAGVLQFTISIPTQWGTITGWVPGKALPDGWSVVSGFGTSTVIIAAGVGVAGIPNGGSYDPADLGGSYNGGGVNDTDIWFSTSGSSILAGTMSVMVSTNQTVANNFTGASRSGVAGATWVI